MTETHLHRRQRAMGAFVGAIVGDALAAPFAAEPPGAFTARFPRPVLTGHGEMLDGGAVDAAHADDAAGGRVADRR